MISPDRAISPHTDNSYGFVGWPLRAQERCQAIYQHRSAPKPRDRRAARAARNAREPATNPCDVPLKFHPAGIRASAGVICYPMLDPGFPSPRFVRQCNRETDWRRPKDGPNLHRQGARAAGLQKATANRGLGRVLRAVFARSAGGLSRPDREAAVSRDSRRRL
jgi:hypothetical protein